MGSVRSVQDTKVDDADVIFTWKIGVLEVRIRDWRQELLYCL